MRDQHLVQRRRKFLSRLNNHTNKGRRSDSLAAFCRMHCLREPAGVPEFNQ